MRRLAHRLFTFGSALSLVICVAACVLWARSYYRNDGVRVTWDHVHVSGDRLAAELALVSGGNVDEELGGIGIRLERTLYPTGTSGDDFRLVPYSRPREYLLLQQPSTGGGYYVDSQASWTWDALGIRLKTYREGEHVVLEDDGPELVARWKIVRGGVLPYWLCSGATALPALGLGRRCQRAARRRQRASRGACADCGYDVRATPGRCPECGREVP